MGVSRPLPPQEFEGSPELGIDPSVKTIGAQVLQDIRNDSAPFQIDAPGTQRTRNRHHETGASRQRHSVCHLRGAFRSRPNQHRALVALKCGGQYLSR